MGIISWIIVGALAGWIASKIMNTDESMGAIANIVVGIIGALIGGFVMNFLGGAGATGINIYSLSSPSFNINLIFSLLNISNLLTNNIKIKINANAKINLNKLFFFIFHLNFYI